VRLRGEDISALVRENSRDGHGSLPVKAVT